MSLILKKCYQGYFRIFNDNADPRANDLFMSSSPFGAILIGLIYLYIVFSLGPNFMKKREPFKLRGVLLLYNFTQVVVNGYLAFHGLKELRNLSWLCSAIDHTPSPHNNFVIRMIHLYYMIKLLDLLDTVFSVLRKKHDQVSFLHVYHHCGMIFCGYIGVKFLSGGHSVFMGLSNSIVHSFMYLYYFLSVWKPNTRSVLRFKKYVTQLQLVQFVFNILTFGPIFFLPECGYPRWAVYIFIPQNLFMLCMFGDYYWKTYIVSKGQKSKGHLL